MSLKYRRGPARLVHRVPADAEQRTAVAVGGGFGGSASRSLSQLHDFFDLGPLDGLGDGLGHRRRHLERVVTPVGEQARHEDVAAPGDPAEAGRRAPRRGRRRARPAGSAGWPAARRRWRGTATRGACSTACRTRRSAPRIAPGTDAMPPITTMANTRRLASAENGLLIDVLADHVLVVDEQHAGDRGEEAGEREPGEHRPQRVDAVRLGGTRVLAQRDQHAAGAAAPDPVGDRDRAARAAPG